MTQSRGGVPLDKVGVPTLQCKKKQSTTRGGVPLDKVGDLDYSIEEAEYY